MPFLFRLTRLTGVRSSANCLIQHSPSYFVFLLTILSIRRSHAVDILTKCMDGKAIISDFEPVTGAALGPGHFKWNLSSSMPRSRAQLNAIL
ncbi:2-methyl-aconitate isomerase [Fusarium oxysporum f. sp. albedinis]|nr:2-methyl-aconitate isomerase [Fusarium oxysporum f. sp. albedinis]